MENPKVSIIVPVFHVEKYLTKCLESILSQTFTEFECILVDDHSTDKSPDICDEYAKKDKRIKVIHKKENEGLPQARSTGFNDSVGDYILFVDSDDWMEPKMVERLYALAKIENYDIVYCTTDNFYESPENEVRYIRKYFDTRKMSKDDIMINLLKYKLDCVVWNKLFKRELFQNIYFPKFWQYEDAVISVQLFLNATRIGYEYSILYHHRDHYDSLTGKNGAGNIKKHNEELLKNWTDIHKIVSQHADYDKYKDAIEWQMNHLDFIKTPSKMRFIMKPLKYIIPYGVIVLYRSLRRRLA